MATPNATLTHEQSMVALEALLNGPAAPPPAGVTSDFTDPANLHVVGTVVLVLCLTLSMLAVLIRMYTKLFIIRSIAPEDCKCPSLTWLACRATDNLDAVVLAWVIYGPDATCFALLILAGRSDCGSHTIYSHSQIWCIDSYVGRTAERFL